jgi:hypothetical protein
VSSLRIGCRWILLSDTYKLPSNDLIAKLGWPKELEKETSGCPGVYKM